jgi:hypothetical protein
MRRMMTGALAATLIGGLSTARVEPALGQAGARQGDEVVTHIFTFSDRALKMGDRTNIVRELVGISRNDKGSGMFHDLAMRCFGFIDIVDGKPSSIGRCVEVDKDGDQVFSTFENKAGAGAHTLIGGTGKYKGITGQQTFGGVSIVKGPDGVASMVIALKVSWKLP